MKKTIFFLSAAAVMFVSCKKTETEYVDVYHTDTVTVTEKTGYYYDSKPLIIDKSDTVIVSYGDIVIGAENADDYMFEFNSTVQDAKVGRHTDYTINCCALGAIPISVDENGMPFVDTDNKGPVEHVTFINRGTITFHTKYLVEKYKNILRTEEDETQKYLYLRCIAMFGLTNSTFINEGKIKFVFDHDPSCTSTVYGIGCSTGAGSVFLNSGEMIFTGNGTRQTRMRAAATYGPRCTFQNKGTINADIEVSDDSRIFTTGGDLTNVINDGKVDVSLSGTTFLFTRYDKATMINNGTINATYRSWPQEFWGKTGNMLAVLYEPVTKSHVDQLPMVNKGIINITMDNTAPANPARNAYGMLFDLTVGSDQEYISNIHYDIVNTGTINTNPNGGNYVMAEAGFKTGANAANVGNTVQLAVGTWNTVLKDFSKQPVFAGNGNIDFSAAKMTFEAPENYIDGTSYSIAPEVLVYKFNPDYNFNVTGYETMEVRAKDHIGYDIVYDKVNQTVALKKIEAAAK